MVVCERNLEGKKKRFHSRGGVSLKVYFGSGSSLTSTINFDPTSIPPMPSSSKVKTTTSKASFDAKVFDWSKKLYSVVSKISSYGEVHEEIFQEFKK